MKRLILPLLILPLAAFAFLPGCGEPPADPWNGTTKLRVVTTFAPIQCFALNVAGEHAEVRGLLTTQGPHHADPPTSHMRMLAGANLFFANGLHVDDRIAGRMSKGMDKKGLKVFYLGDEIPKDKLIEGSCACCKEEGDAHDHDHDHKSYDGHVWLGIEQAAIIVKKMGDAFVSVDPEFQQKHASGSHFDNAAGNYCNKLKQLHVDGQALLKDKKNRAILPFHGSLAYFAKSFDLKLIDPIQEVPGQEPSAKHLDEIVKACIKEKVRVIAVEPQYNAETSAKAILEELKRRGMTDVEIVTIDPLETCPDGEMDAGWYERKMRTNLETLAKALR